MTNLILVHPNDRHNITKTIIEIDDWRVIGIVERKFFYLVTSDCKVYHINDLTLKKFKALLRCGLDMSRPGLIDSISLVCPKCGGSGITDWVSDVVGVKIARGDIPKFKRDPDKPVKMSTIFHNNKPFTGHVSTAKLPDAHKYCSECKGSGLYITTRDYAIGCG
jgi:hypothetical protein